MRALGSINAKSIALVLAVMVALALSASATSAGEPPLPSALQGVDIEEHLGRRVPLDLAFTDMNGRPVTLDRYFNHGRPVILALGYFRCPMLCALVTAGLGTAVRASWVEPGRDVDLLTVSIDPTDQPAAAAEKRAQTLAPLQISTDVETWPFLVGDIEPIRTLADTVGFRYNYLPSIHQYAHEAVLIVLTADGRVSRYLYGLKPEPRDLRLALAEAREGRTGLSFERVLLSCFRWNPAARRYYVFVHGFLRIGALIVFFALLTLVLVCVRFERRRAARAA